MLREMCKLRSSSLCNFLHSSVRSTEMLKVAQLVMEFPAFYVRPNLVPF
jgi:hypothetical protein